MACSVARVAALVVPLVIVSSVPTTARADSAVERRWKNEVVYQILIDRFYDGDPSNNYHKTIPKESDRLHPGDLRGVIEKLDYIHDLGATAILINPIVLGSSYHGYDVVDLFSVSPPFGTDADYRELIRKAHALGIKVIFDFVANHVSPSSPLVKKHPKWFHQPQSSKAWNDSYIPETWSHMQFFGLRDLDQSNPAVYRHLLRAARHWMRFGIDGFRMDAVTLISPAFWKRFNADIRRHAKPGFLILGEVYANLQAVLSQYEPYFDAVFDFRLYDAVLGHFVDGENPRQLSYALERDPTYRRRHVLQFTFLQSHDVPRLLSSMMAKSSEETARAKMRQALVMQMTSRGVPVILYGTEIDMLNDPRVPKSVPYAASRTPMRFDNNREHPSYQLLRKLIALRKAVDFNGKQRVIHVDDKLHYASYSRGKRGAFAIALFNLSDSPAEMVTNLRGFKGMPAKMRLTDYLAKNQDFAVDDGLVKTTVPAHGSRVLLAPALAERLRKRLERTAN